MPEQTKIKPLKGIYELALGEVSFVGGFEFTRVPGGWLTITVRGMAFIPFHNEFMPQGEVNEHLPF